MGYIGNQITTVFPSSISVDSATISGNTTIGGTLGVTGASTLSSTLAVTGVSTLSDNIVFDASSKGVHLGVTSATSTNLLDDYEEGTWTPAFTSTGASFSYTTQSGEYIKVGRIVFVSFRIQLSGSPSGTTSNTTFLTGLPIAIDSTAHFGGTHAGHYFQINKTSTDEELVYQAQPGDTRFEIKMVGDNQGESNLTPAQMNSTAQIRSSVTYLAGS